MTLEEAEHLFYEVSNDYIRFDPNWVVIDGTFDRKQIEVLIVLLKAFLEEEEERK
jgi:hypothetical protein